VLPTAASGCPEPEVAALETASARNRRWSGTEAGTVAFAVRTERITMSMSKEAEQRTPESVAAKVVKALLKFNPRKQK